MNSDAMRYSAQNNEMLDDLVRTGLSLIVQHDGAVLFSSADATLRPLVECLRRHRPEMHGASVADKVVGLAAARLLSAAQVGEVRALVASTAAVECLQAAGVYLYARTTVPRIMNKDATGLCPMEALAMATEDPEALFLELSARLKLD